jgi:hypothetical protein
VSRPPPPRSTTIKPCSLDLCPLATLRVPEGAVRPRLRVRSRSFSASVASEQESSPFTDRRWDRRERAPPRPPSAPPTGADQSTTRRSTKPIRLRRVTQSKPVRARGRRVVSFLEWRPHVGGPGRRLWGADLPAGSTDTIEDRSTSWTGATTLRPGRSRTSSRPRSVLRSGRCAKEAS